MTRIQNLKSIFILLSSLTISLYTFALPTEIQLEPRQSSGNIIKNGSATYTGACSNGVCSWKGLRYAQPPTGNLRFSPALPPSKSPSGNIDSTQFGPMCLQSGSGTMSEDCLFANIYRPSNVPLTTRLPVLIFVHGGGFQSGAGSQHDPSDMIQAGGSDLQAIVVTINYRLGLFGFLGGTTFNNAQKRNSNDISQNMGFTDVRQAINWCHQNIHYFGGTGDKITIWGQSAGSFASAAQMLGSPSNSKFSSVILESGSPGGVPIVPPSKKDSQFNTVLQNTNCQGSSNVISCLRSISSSSLLTISNNQANLTNDVSTIPFGYYAWTPVQDGGPSRGGFFYDRPSQVINSGNFARVPLLHGDCYDEGTYFAYQDSENSQETFDYFKKIYFTDDNVLNSALQQYPDNPIVGSPYKPVDGDYSDRYYGLTNQYKRISSLYGDIRYQSNRRFFLNAVAKKGITTYSYEFAQYVQGNAISIGFPHGSDLDFVFNQQDQNPFGSTLSRQWLSFAIHQTPNYAGNSAPIWPRYTSSSPNLLYYANNSITTVSDSFRQSQIAFLNSPAALAATYR